MGLEQEVNRMISEGGPVVKVQAPVVNNSRFPERVHIEKPALEVVKVPSSIVELRSELSMAGRE